LIDKKRGSFTSRDLALVAGLTGLYLVYGYASGVTFGHTILELDLFFLISALFTIVSMIGKRWSATLLAPSTVSSFSENPTRPSRLPSP